MSDLKKLHWPDGSKATLHESTGKLRGFDGKCEVQPFSSAVCARGTRSCTVMHMPAPVDIIHHDLHESTGRKERDLAADIHALAQVHTVFAATVTPLMQELRTLIRNQDTKIARLESEVAMLRMSIPVRIA